MISFDGYDNPRERDALYWVFGFVRPYMEAFLVFA